MAEVILQSTKRYGGRFQAYFGMVKRAGQEANFRSNACSQDLRCHRRCSAQNAINSGLDGYRKPTACAAHVRFPGAICAYLAFDGQKLDKENPKAASGNPWCWQCVTD